MADYTVNTTGIHTPGNLNSDNGNFSTDGAGNVAYNGIKGQGETAAGSLQTLAANGNTITLVANTLIRHITGASAFTGLILTVGTEAGQQLILVNDSANAQTFAASGTSNVAEGTGANVPANGKLVLVWSANLSLWV